MKLLLHHFWKDVRLMRWLLALWLLVLAIQAVLMVLSVQPDYERASSAARVGSSALLALAVNITWALVIVRLLQAEPVTGTTSFWRTRPIPIGVFIVSKFTFIAVLAILPTLLVHALELSLYSIPLEAQEEIMAYLLAIDVMTTAAIIWLATYTRSLFQFWGVVCVLGVVFAVYMAFSIQYRVSRPAEVPDFRWMGLCGSLFAGGLMVSLILQYGFHRTRAAFLTGVAGIAFGLFGGIEAPLVLISTVATLLRHPSGAGLISGPIAYQVDDQTPLHWSPSTIIDQSNESARIRLIPPAADARGTPIADWAAGNFRTEDGKQIGIGTGYTGEPAGNQFDWTSALQKANPGLTVVQPLPQPTGQFIGIQVPIVEGEKVKGQRGTLNLTITGHLLTLTRCAVMPLSGPRFAHIPYGALWVVSPSPEGSGLTLKLKLVAYQKGVFGSFPMTVLFVDAKDGIGIVSQPMGSSSSSNDSLGTAEWIQISESKTIGFQPAFLPAAVQAKIRNNRVEDWALYIYKQTPAPGYFESQVAVPNLTF
jgi:hypothetical protein